MLFAFNQKEQEDDAAFKVRSGMLHVWRNPSSARMRLFCAKREEERVRACFTIDTNRFALINKIEILSVGIAPSFFPRLTHAGRFYLVSCLSLLSFTVIARIKQRVVYLFFFTSVNHFAMKNRLIRLICVDVKKGFFKSSSLGSLFRRKCKLIESTGSPLKCY